MILFEVHDKYLSLNLQLVCTYYPLWEITQVDLYTLSINMWTHSSELKIKSDYYAVRVS